MSNKSIFQLMETKSNYISPKIELILLDNNISLALQSEEPPVGPFESRNGSDTTDFLRSNPINSELI
jgi:hypothetical protein